MTVMPTDAEIERAAQVSFDDAAAITLGSEGPDATAALDALDANADARTELRRRSDKRELQLAARDLTEGLRGMIRVAPISAVIVGVAVGMFIRGRSKPRALPPRRAPR